MLQYNFDSLEYEDIKTAKALFVELKSRLHSERTYLLLDEIQEVSEWEKGFSNIHFAGSSRIIENFSVER